MEESPPPPPSPGDEKSKKSKLSLTVSPAEDKMKGKKRDKETREGLDYSVKSALGEEASYLPCPKSPLKKRSKFDPNILESGGTSSSYQGQSELSLPLDSSQAGLPKNQGNYGEDKTPGNTQSLENVMEGINIGPLDQDHGALSPHSAESIPNVFTSSGGKKKTIPVPLIIPSMSSPGSHSESGSLLTPSKLNFDSSFPSLSPNSSPKGVEFNYVTIVERMFQTHFVKSNLESKAVDTDIDSIPKEEAMEDTEMTCEASQTTQRSDLNINLSSSLSPKTPGMVSEPTAMLQERRITVQSPYIMMNEEEKLPRATPGKYELLSKSSSHQSPGSSTTSPSNPGGLHLPLIESEENTGALRNLGSSHLTHSPEQESVQTPISHDNPENVQECHECSSVSPSKCNSCVRRKIVRGWLKRSYSNPAFANQPGDDQSSPLESGQPEDLEHLRSGRLHHSPVQQNSPSNISDSDRALAPQNMPLEETGQTSRSHGLSGDCHRCGFNRSPAKCNSCIRKEVYTSLQYYRRVYSNPSGSNPAQQAGNEPSNRSSSHHAPLNESGSSSSHQSNPESPTSPNESVRCYYCKSLFTKTSQNHFALDENGIPCHVCKSCYGNVSKRGSRQKKSGCVMSCEKFLEMFMDPRVRVHRVTPTQSKLDKVLMSLQNYFSKLTGARRTERITGARPKEKKRSKREKAAASPSEGSCVLSSEMGHTSTSGTRSPLFSEMGHPSTSGTRSPLSSEMGHPSMSGTRCPLSPEMGRPSTSVAGNSPPVGHPSSSGAVFYHSPLGIIYFIDGQMFLQRLCGISIPLNLPRTTGPSIPGSPDISMPAATGHSMPGSPFRPIPGSPGVSMSGSRLFSMPGSPGISLPGAQSPSMQGASGSSRLGSPVLLMPESPGVSMPGTAGPSMPVSPFLSVPGSPGFSVPGAPGPSMPRISGISMFGAQGASMPGSPGLSIPEAPGPSIPGSTGISMPEQQSSSIPGRQNTPENVSPSRRRLFMDEN